MKLKFFAAGAALLAACMVGPYAKAADSPVKKHSAAKAAKKPAKPRPASVEEQIQQLRHELESQKAQIEELKSDLSGKDARLRKAEQSAASAQAKADAEAAAEQQAGKENSVAVATLDSAVSGLKAEEAGLSKTVATETAKIRKAVANPAALHYKGITIAPNGFLAGEAAYRSHGTGGEIATPFSTIPYEHADAYSLSEFYGSGRQSRIGLVAEGKVGWGTLRGVYEADFLGSGTTANPNESNSYVLRQRLVYAQAETNSRWTFAAGQMWTLATEDKKGITTAAADIATPLTIDPNYLPGFVWARQFGFRVSRAFDKLAVAIAAENPQILYTATLAGNTPYAVLGSGGANGAFMNAAVSSCSPTTSIVNYTNQAVTTSGGQTANIAVPVYKTVNACGNLANISFNAAPDLMAKVAIDPGWGHYEVYGIARFAHETIYPGETTNSNLYGGLKDIVTGAVIAPTLTTSGASSDSVLLGGAGASMRIPIVRDKFTVGAKGMYGPGVGRYSAALMPDVTANAAGALVPIHNLAGLMTVEASPSPRLVLWANYGGDYASRAAYAGGSTLGAPTAAQDANGVWGGHWAAPTTAAVGYGSKLLNNSACVTNANPGYSGTSTGFYPGGSCGAQNRAVQEITGGYWYDFYKGDRGRLRQSVQYGYLVREGWSGANGIGAKGIENMFLTTFRYYLP